MPTGLAHTCCQDSAGHFIDCYVGELLIVIYILWSDKSDGQVDIGGETDIGLKGRHGEY